MIVNPPSQRPPISAIFELVCEPGNNDTHCCTNMTVRIFVVKNMPGIVWFVGCTVKMIIVPGLVDRWRSITGKYGYSTKRTVYRLQKRFTKIRASFNRNIGIKPYPGDSRSWWSMGDENGLLLCIPKGRKWGMQTNTPQKFEVFPTVATIRGHGKGIFKFENYPYEVHLKKS